MGVVRETLGAEERVRGKPAAPWAPLGDGARGLRNSGRRAYTRAAADSIHERPAEHRATRGFLGRAVSGDTGAHLGLAALTSDTSRAWGSKVCAGESKSL